MRGCSNATSWLASRRPPSAGGDDCLDAQGETISAAPGHLQASLAHRPRVRMSRGWSLRPFARLHGPAIVLSERTGLSALRRGPFSRTAEVARLLQATRDLVRSTARQCGQGRWMSRAGWSENDVSTGPRRTASQSGPVGPTGLEPLTIALSARSGGILGSSR